MLRMGIYTLLIHDLLVSKCGVLHRNQTLSWRSVFSHVVIKESWFACVLLDVIVHNPIEALVFAAEIDITLAVLK